ncbi:dynamin family protein [Nostoc sp.]|uniref:dynamin family protein n=1 Tax=Nostoc sp. TaxID=1180 RepID=UPI002FF5ED35
MMNTLLIGNQVVDLLSRITGQKLTQRDATRPVIFLANLVTVLLGVMFVDGIVTDEKKQRLLAILYRFSTPGSDVRRLTHLMIKGIKEDQLYLKVNELLTLINPLTQSERLLLIGFGYEMSAANSEGNSRKQQYLRLLAKYLDVKPQHSLVLAAAFKPEKHFDKAVLNEVYMLLEPERFQGEGTVFIKGSGDKLRIMPVKTIITEPHVPVSYEGLKKFHELNKQLDNYCQQIFQIVQACSEGNFVPKDLIDEVSMVLKNLQSQRFRLAVVGEFSQGKSTLINALLGEEIQPTREIPCSGTVTVLKYGMQKRIVCRYKDGSEEEIEFDEYQQKASISEDTAIGCPSDKLLQSEIEEIIFEHPDLELCSSGVEIIDSPGLNEHPELTAVTQKLLQDIDAAIFLTNASRSLTQGERNLLHELKIKLNHGKDDKPANNLFIVGNFMDLVRTEKGREQVKQRIYNFVEGDNPIITGKNRVHFISVQAALDAILNGYEDEYRKNFNSFTKSIEKFLMIERGALKLERSVDEINKLIQKVISRLKKTDDTLKDNMQTYQTEKQKILEQIGEASGRDVKICVLAVRIIEQALEKANTSWDEWYQGLSERMILRSDHWYSKHGSFWSKDKLIREYIPCFMEDLIDEINEWNKNQMNDIILRDSLQILNESIQYELSTIQADFQQLYIKSDTSFNNRLDFFSGNINSEFMGFSSVSISNALGVEIGLSPGGISFIAAFIAAIIAKVTMIINTFELEEADDDELYNPIKIKVLEIGLEKFDQCIDKVYEKLYENFDTAFDSQVESANRFIEQSISLYENLLEQQEKAEQESIKKYNISKAFILQQCQQLEQVQNGINTDIGLWYSEIINKINY